ncbi:MAG: hypothetical protein HGA97_09615 [Chlorobiaceae bacterium]|nr:hypothetical protein [Chlorobiaceae bacterium]
MSTRTYSVKGMHCPSCEAIIEKRVRSLDGVTHVEASMVTGTLTTSCKEDPPSPDSLQKLFPEGLYSFSVTPAIKPPLTEVISVIGFSVAALALFFGLSASGLLPVLTIDSNSSAGSFFLFGLIAGLSTCAALVGSLILALSTQWHSRDRKPASLVDKLRPQMLFNTGRIAAYGLTGALLGLLGESIRISSGFTTVMFIAVSFFMIVLALQMLGFTPLNRLRIALPKRLTEKAGSGIMNNGLIRPFPSGFMTILLPCGFTLAAEAAAMLSGSPWKGLLVMTLFVLGTLPPLLFIGLSSSGLSTRPSTSRLFMKSAGLLVIFFTLFNLNSQIGITSRLTPSASATSGATAKTGRIIRTASSGGALASSRFELRSGEKVRFIIDAKDNGSGCMNAVMVPGLWNHAEYLVKGKPVVLEFTPSRPGVYPITCAMGMPWGVINVK